MLEVVLETVDDEYIYLKLANIYSKLDDKEMIKFTLERAVRKNQDSYVLMGALADYYRSDEETATKSFELYKKSIRAFRQSPVCRRGSHSSCRTERL